MAFWQRDVPIRKASIILAGVAALFVLCSMKVAIAPLKSLLERNAICTASLDYMRESVRRRYVPPQLRQGHCKLSNVSLADQTTARYQGEASFDGNLSWITSYTVDLAKTGDTWRVISISYGPRTATDPDNISIYDKLFAVFRPGDAIVILIAFMLPGMTMSLFWPFAGLTLFFGWQFAIYVSFGYYLLQFLIGGINAYD